MSHLVIIQVTAGCEPFTTNSTLMRFLSTVYSSVSVEAGAGAESFVAFWADVRLLSCVSSDVSLQQTGSVKCFATNIARKHCLGFWSPSWTCSWNSLLRKGKQRRWLWLKEECWWCGYWWWHHEWKCSLTNKWNYTRSFQQWCDGKIILWIFLFSNS